MGVVVVVGENRDVATGDLGGGREVGKDVADGGLDKGVFGRTVLVFRVKPILK